MLNLRLKSSLRFIVFGILLCVYIGVLALFLEVQLTQCGCSGLPVADLLQNQNAILINRLLSCSWNFKIGNTQS